MLKICRFRSSCACIKYHPGLCSPFIHSIVSVVSNDSVSSQWESWSDCKCALWSGPSLSVYARRCFCMAPYDKYRSWYGIFHNIPLVSSQNIRTPQAFSSPVGMVVLRMFVRLSLLTVTYPNQLCDVLLFVCSKMSDETNLSSKLPVADRTREVWGRKFCWWCLSSGFPLCTFLLGFADSFCFIFTSSPFYEASPLCTILCNLFP